MTVTGLDVRFGPVTRSVSGLLVTRAGACRLSFARRDRHSPQYEHHRLHGDGRRY